ncbi:hypothetical protein [Pedobacter psychroterrae]|uniref:DUF4367 domain-containing protein n=1 Tax=Pedobacter psychroterrae TaxID=2530453 RepID=A0A4R0NDA2_9SPHI|nr:hypothetical protein [Pedobacter psychroterrae]TCC98245.1 hypothetical protein EZ437_18815 [Pedobacter psychroterrae]
METSENKKFTVNINKDGSNAQSTEVTHKETTDGLSYYICKIGENEVQLRKDDHWEVIWGELDPEKVATLGAEIDKHILKHS